MNRENDIDQLLSSMDNTGSCSILNAQYAELQNVVIPTFNRNSQYTTSSNHSSSNSIHLEENYKVSVTVSQEDKDKLRDLLIGWRMGYLLQTCLAECVDVEALHYINSVQIAQLLYKYPLGTQIKFNYYVKQWQYSNRKDTQNESTPNRQSTSSIPFTASQSMSSESANSFFLNDILTKSAQGVLITDYYTLNNNLNEACRNLLVNLIMSSLIEKKMSMTVSLAHCISTEITRIFPTELKIDIDFKRLYGNNVTDMLSTFDQSFNNILTIFYDRIKDMKIKKWLCDK